MMTQPHPFGQRVAMLLVTVAAACLSGCGAEGDRSSAPGTWLTLEGPDGATLRFDAPPSRIVAGSAGVTEILLELIDRERIAAVPDQVFQGWATDCGTREQWDGRILKRYRGEDLLAFRPDLVIAQSYQSADAARVIRELGVPVLLLPEIATFEDLIRDIELIASCVDASDRADALVADLKRRHDALSSDQRRADVRILSYSNYGTGGWTAGAACAADLMIRLAGMKNAGAEGGRARHWQLDVERFAAIDPDVVLLGQDTRGETPAAHVLRRNTTLAKLRAVQAKRIVTLPAALWNTTSHRLLDAAEQLAAAVDDAMRDQD